MSRWHILNPDKPGTLCGAPVSRDFQKPNTTRAEWAHKPVTYPQCWQQAQDLRVEPGERIKE